MKKEKWKMKITYLDVLKGHLSDDVGKQDCKILTLVSPGNVFQPKVSDTEVPGFCHIGSQYTHEGVVISFVCPNIVNKCDL